MGFEGLLKLIAEEFSKARIRYALIGGFALHAAGYARTTGDVDMLVYAEDVAKAKDILLPRGYKIVHETEDVLNLSSPWQLVGGVDIIKARRHYALAMLERAKDYEAVDGVQIPSVVVEDLIGLKIQAMANDPSREMQDMADIEWLFRHYQQTINKERIREYAALFSVNEKLEKLLKEA